METGRAGKNRQSGFALVELMVAIALSIVLLFGILQIFDANRQSSRLLQALAEVQENGRTAMELIARDVRVADAWGCAPDTSALVSHLAGGVDTWMNFVNTRGVEARNDVNSESIGTKRVKDGTDVLVLRGAYQPRNARVVSPYVSAGNAIIHITTGARIELGDIVMLADCVGGDIFVNTVANTEQTGKVGYGAAELENGLRNAGMALSRTYAAAARIVAPFEKIYFIGENIDSGWSLYRSDNGSISELVRNVDDLQLFFGADNDKNGAADTFGSAAVVEFDKVVSIRAQISVHSMENVAGGNVLRRYYTATTNIRNRSL